MHIKRALIPGTFDPVTLGHLSVIRTASSLFDEVTVCILVNPEKTCMFDEQTRVEALEIALRELSNVKIDVSHHMTADYAKEIGAEFIVRGIRNAEDAAYELEMADFNRKRTGVETIWLPTPAELRTISSTHVRTAIQSGSTLAGLLPDGVAELLKNKNR